MASDQGMALERDRVLGDSKDPEMVAVRKPDPKRRECLPRVLRNVRAGRLLPAAGVHTPNRCCWSVLVMAGQEVGSQGSDVLRSGVLASGGEHRTPRWSTCARRWWALQFDEVHDLRLVLAPPVCFHFPDVSALRVPH